MAAEFAEKLSHCPVAAIEGTNFAS